MSTMSTNTQSQPPSPSRRPPLDKALNGLEGMDVVTPGPSSPVIGLQDSRDTGHHPPPEPALDNVAPVPRAQADSLVAHETSQHSSEPTNPTLEPVQESHTVEDSIRPFNASERPEGDEAANPRAEVGGPVPVRQGSARSHDWNRKLEKMMGEAANFKFNGADAESKRPSTPSTH